MSHSKPTTGGPGKPEDAARGSRGKAEGNGRGGRGKNEGAGRKRRGTVIEDEEGTIYCLENSKGESGTIVLSKPTAKKDVMVAALKGGVSYYRLQKFNPSVTEVEGKFEIVGVLATE